MIVLSLSGFTLNNVIYQVVLCCSQMPENHLMQNSLVQTDCALPQRPSHLLKPVDVKRQRFVSILRKKSYCNARKSELIRFTGTEYWGK